MPRNKTKFGEVSPNKLTRDVVIKGDHSSDFSKQDEQRRIIAENKENNGKQERQEPNSLKLPMVEKIKKRFEELSAELVRYQQTVQEVQNSFREVGEQATLRKLAKWNSQLWEAPLERSQHMERFMPPKEYARDIYTRMLRAHEVLRLTLRLTKSHEADLQNIQSSLDDAKTFLEQATQTKELSQAIEQMRLKISRDIYSKRYKSTIEAAEKNQFGRETMDDLSIGNIKDYICITTKVIGDNGNLTTCYRSYFSLSEGIIVVGFAYKNTIDANSRKGEPLDHSDLLINQALEITEKAKELGLKAPRNMAPLKRIYRYNIDNGRAKSIIENNVTLKERLKHFPKESIEWLEMMKTANAKSSKHIAQQYQDTTGWRKLDQVIAYRHPEFCYLALDFVDVQQFGNQ